MLIENSSGHKHTHTQTQSNYLLHTYTNGPFEKKMKKISRKKNKKSAKITLSPHETVVKLQFILYKCPKEN